MVGVEYLWICVRDWSCRRALWHWYENVVCVFGRSDLRSNTPPAGSHLRRHGKGCRQAGGGMVTMHNTRGSNPEASGS